MNNITHFKKFKKKENWTKFAPPLFGLDTFPLKILFFELSENIC